MTKPYPSWIPLCAALASAALAAAVGAPVPADAASLRGSKASMVHQYRVAQDHDFTLLKTTQEVRRFVDLGLLERVTGDRNVAVEGASYPYARPALRLFIERLGEQYRAATGEKLVVTSLTRPVSRQPRNASTYSVHPTGMAVDFRRSRNRSARRWLENTLKVLEDRGVLDATYEKHPPHYHVAIFPKQYEAYVARKEDAAPQVASASPEPVATPAPTPGPAATDASYLPYQVQQGDSLWSIAQQHGTTVSRLKKLNAMSSSRIFPGQTLMVPE